MKMLIMINKKFKEILKKVIQRHSDLVGQVIRVIYKIEDYLFFVLAPLIWSFLYTRVRDIVEKTIFTIRIFPTQIIEVLPAYLKAEYFEIISMMSVILFFSALILYRSHRSNKLSKLISK